MKEDLLINSKYLSAGFEAFSSFIAIGNVLVTKQSKLVSVILIEEKKQLISVDSDYMMRKWDLESGKQDSVILLKTNQKKKLTCANVDVKRNLIAISNEDGLITVHNIYSGTLLYSLP